MNIIVMYEGVLRSSTDRPIMDGFLLVQSLAAANRVFIATSGPSEFVAHHLRTERLQDLITDIVDSTSDLPPLPLWQRQIEVLRHEQGATMVVAADPAVVEWAVSRRMVGVLFAHPGFSRPPLRPEQGSRSWESLLQEMEARP